MLGPQPDPHHHRVPPKEGPDGDQRQTGASDRGLDEVCLYQTAAGALYSEVALTPMPPVCSPTPTPRLYLGQDAGTQGGGQGGNRGPTNTSSEGYGTEEECVLSDPQGESDADADIEDTDCRLHEPGGLQRVSSRRRKRPRLTRQDTTESEDDGGRSQRAPNWNLRLSPHRAHSRTILEESVSQVRPLVIRRRSSDAHGTGGGGGGPEASRGPKRAPWPSAPPLLILLLLLFLLLPLSLVILVVTFLFIPWASV